MMSNLMVPPDNKIILKCLLTGTKHVTIEDSQLGNLLDIYSIKKCKYLEQRIYHSITHCIFKRLMQSN